MTFEQSTSMTSKLKKPYLLVKKKKTNFDFLKTIKNVMTKIFLKKITFSKHLKLIAFIRLISNKKQMGAKKPNTLNNSKFNLKLY